MRKSILSIVGAWTLVGVLTGVVFAAPPRPENHIRDDAALLSPGVESQLETFLDHVQRERDVEILVLTIQQLPGKHRNFIHANRSEVTIDSYAKQLFNNYRIGTLPANQGVLLLIARNDRECRIELGAGYSSRMDAVAKRIIDRTMIPEFKRGNYELGISLGVHEIGESIAGLPTADSARGIGWWWFALPTLLLASGGVIGLSLSLNGKRGWGWVVIGVAYIQYLRMRNWYRQPSYGSSDSSGGFYDDGGSSFGGYDGGGFDGGGGFSDGGGASGSW